MAKNAKGRGGDDGAVNLDLVEQFDTYEDYLDSQLTETDMNYLEDEEMARQLVELGYRGLGDTIRRLVYYIVFDICYCVVNDGEVILRIGSNVLIIMLFLFVDNILVERILKLESDCCMKKRIKSMLSQNNWLVLTKNLVVDSWR